MFDQGQGGDTYGDREVDGGGVDRMTHRDVTVGDLTLKEGRPLVDRILSSPDRGGRIGLVLGGIDGAVGLVLGGVCGLAGAFTEVLRVVGHAVCAVCRDLMEGLA